MALPGEESVFFSPGPAGLKAEGIAAMFPPPSCFTAFIDGEKARDKAGLLREAAVALRFPSYFGGNWDALLDCLRSLPEFNPAGGYALVILNSGSLLSASQADLADFRDVAETAGAFLREKLRIKFKIFLCPSSAL